MCSFNCFPVPAPILSARALSILFIFAGDARRAARHARPLWNFKYSPSTARTIFRHDARSFPSNLSLFSLPSVPPRSIAFLHHLLVSGYQPLRNDQLPSVFACKYFTSSSPACTRDASSSFVCCSNNENNGTGPRVLQFAANFRPRKRIPNESVRANCASFRGHLIMCVQLASDALRRGVVELPEKYWAGSNRRYERVTRCLAFRA